MSLKKKITVSVNKNKFVDQKLMNSAREAKKRGEEEKKKIKIDSHLKKR